MAITEGRCDWKEKALFPPFDIFWAIISYLRCKETCLALAFYKRQFFWMEKENSGALEILIYRGLGKLISCSCSNFPSNDELKEYSLDSWNQHSVVLAVHHWSNKQATDFRSTENQRFWSHKNFQNCYLEIFDYVANIENWRSAPTLVLNPRICSPSVTFAFMRSRSKPNINKIFFYFGWKSCWLIAALPAGEWLFRIILDALKRKSSNNGLIKDEPVTQ